MRSAGKHGFNVLVVACIVLALDREDMHAVVCHEIGRDVVLRRERIARAEPYLGAACGERDHEVGGLRRDVQARTHAQPAQRLCLCEPLADGFEHGHALTGPCDASLAHRGKRWILHIRRVRCGAYLGRQSTSPRALCKPSMAVSQADRAESWLVRFGAATFAARDASRRKGVTRTERTRAPNALGAHEPFASGV